MAAKKHTSVPIKGERLQLLQEEAIKKVQSCFLDTQSYVEIIQGLAQWDEHVSNMTKTRQVPAFVKKVRRDGKTDGDNLNKLLENLVIVWAMQPDSKFLPLTVENVIEQGLLWFNAVVDELKLVTQNKPRHFIYFPTAKSHETRGEEINPVQHMNEAIRKWLSESGGDTMQHHAQHRVSTDDEVGHRDQTASSAASSPAGKRKRSDQQPRPDKQARTEDTSTPSPIGPKHEDASETTYPKPTQSIPEDVMATTDSSSVAESHANGPGPHKDYNSMKRKARLWMDACTKLDAQMKEKDKSNRELRAELQGKDKTVNDLEERLREVTSSCDAKLVASQQRITDLEGQVKKSQSDYQQIKKSQSDYRQAEERLMGMTEDAHDLALALAAETRRWQETMGWPQGHGAAPSTGAKYDHVVGDAQDGAVKSESLSHGDLAACPHVALGPQIKGSPVPSTPETQADALDKGYTDYFSDSSDIPSPDDSDSA